MSASPLSPYALYSVVVVITYCAVRSGQLPRVATEGSDHSIASILFTSSKNCAKKQFCVFVGILTDLNLNLVFNQVVTLLNCVGGESYYRILIIE